MVNTRFTDLFRTLLKIRLHVIALVADNKKAFLNIRIRNDDKDALRFVSKKKGSFPLDTKIERMEVYKSLFWPCTVCFTWEDQYTII